jgi:hypothetical protein
MSLPISPSIVAGAVARTVTCKVAVAVSPDESVTR